MNPGQTPHKNGSKRLLKPVLIVLIAGLVLGSMIYMIEASYSVTKEEADKLPPLPKNTSDVN